MTRQNLFSGLWDGDRNENGTRCRVFWRPDDARLGATLYELAPHKPEDRIHMHYGAEEMFFVLSGRPSFRNQNGEETLAPGDVVFCPEGRAGLHTFSNPTDEPVEILAVSAGSFPDVVLDHPERVRGIAVLNIIPTIDQFTRMADGPALGYWPWLLLAQPDARRHRRGGGTARRRVRRLEPVGRRPSCRNRPQRTLHPRGSPPRADRRPGVIPRAWLNRLPP